MNRVEALRELCEDFNGKRIAASLTEAEFDAVVEFIEDHDHLPYIEFEQRAVRWGLDDPKKPKNIFRMQELVVSANTRALALKKF